MSDIDYQAAVGKEVYSLDGANVGHVTELVDQVG
jgi:sporulation protein YlmC with PRC-barrel domain